MHVLLLWPLPMGIVAAVRPKMATAISQGIAVYLASLPEPTYARFGTG